MDENVLVLNVCKERLHGLEFVRPVEEILRQSKLDHETCHYKQLTERILNRCTHMIICGTSLRDNHFIEDVDKFRWLFDNFPDKPVLGICAGMQIIGVTFGEKLKKNQEIGYYHEKVSEDFLGLEKDFDEGEYEVWHLHNSYVDFSENAWKIFMRSSDAVHIPQAVKHKEKKIYGVLFHPEVRQKEMILEFVKNG
ncbi:hypothetical protein CMI41_02865 [Candidatus Pacearchaeota archaeon]|nr:hypothetical protein [Candidatus Pacearchaeota archaeon]|tara:strand:+ start:8755 stop:9339 length:585 start_codon:yes stop_codon:yes gene_type:complete